MLESERERERTEKKVEWRKNELAWKNVALCENPIEKIAYFVNKHTRKKSGGVKKGANRKEKKND